MLTIKDLATSKDLDSKAMASVAGGTGIPAFVMNLMSPVNTPKAGEMFGMSGSATGPQLNNNFQSDDDTNIVMGSGQVVNYGGNSNQTMQSAASVANNFLSMLQS